MTRFDASLAGFVDDLLETLYTTEGIGLSAPQVGDVRRVLVADLSDDNSAPQVYINPEILSKTATGIVEESCLSLPGVIGSVMRSTRLRVRAQDATGSSFERDLEAMNAVCLQHEVDHLDGKLFIDRLWLGGRWKVRKALKALEQRSAMVGA